MRVQLIRHFETCTTDIYIHNECAHVGLSVRAPVRFGMISPGDLAQWRLALSPVLLLDLVKGSTAGPDQPVARVIMSPPMCHSPPESIVTQITYKQYYQLVLLIHKRYTRLRHTRVTKLYDPAVYCSCDAALIALRRASTLLPGTTCRRCCCLLLLVLLLSCGAALLLVWLRPACTQ